MLADADPEARAKLYGHLGVSFAYRRSAGTTPARWHYKALLSYCFVHM